MQECLHFSKSEVQAFIVYKVVAQQVVSLCRRPRSADNVVVPVPRGACRHADRFAPASPPRSAGVLFGRQQVAGWFTRGCQSVVGWLPAGQKRPPQLISPCQGRQAK